MFTDGETTLFFSRLQRQGVAFNEAENFYSEVMNHPFTWVRMNDYPLRGRFSPGRKQGRRLEVEAVEPE